MTNPWSQLPVTYPGQSLTHNSRRHGLTWAILQLPDHTRTLREQLVLLSQVHQELGFSGQSLTGPTGLHGSPVEQSDMEADGVYSSMYPSGVPVSVLAMEDVPVCPQLLSGGRDANVAEEGDDSRFGRSGLPSSGSFLLFGFPLMVLLMFLACFEMSFLMSETSHISRNREKQVPCSSSPMCGE